MNSLNRVFAVALAMPLSLPAAAQHAAYPLYFINVKGEASLSDPDIDLLARNFLFGHFGMTGCSAETINRFHAINPHFLALRYVSTQRTDYGACQINAEHNRMDLLYYHCATLSQPISESATQFTLSPVAGPIRLKASTIQADFTDPEDPIHKYVYWIRIEDELMRVEEWDPKSGRIRVARGFDGTQAAAYPGGSNVLAPMGTARSAGRAESKGGKESPISRYSYDPARPGRWKASLESALNNAQDGFDGTWYDLICAEPFKPGDVDGNPVNDAWDCERHQNYAVEDYRLACEKGLDCVMKSYHDQLGKWPIIFINSLKTTQYYPGQGAIQNYLLSTPQKPRPVDGYCIEAFAGSVAGGRGEDAARITYLTLERWKSKVSVLMDAAQRGLAAVPYCAMAGAENSGYERIDNETRSRFELWAYASYLLGVERKEGKCSTAFGINPFYWEGEQRKAILNPRYMWDLGDPAESRLPEDLDSYQIAGHETYVRKFQKGLVLVNPSGTEDTDVPLGGECTDPVTNERMTTVTMAAQTGRILLTPMK